MYIKSDREHSEHCSLKYKSVILVLFIVSCTSIGISCYALYRIQSLSEDINTRILRTLLNHNERNGDVIKYNDWGDNIGAAKGEPILKTFSNREKRSLSPKNSHKVDTHSTIDSMSEESTTATEPLPNIRKNLHHLSKKNVNYGDEPEAETFTPQYHRNTYRHSHRGRHNNQLEIIDEFSPQAGRLKSLMAIHFNGDTSKYVYGQHSNFNGNGHLRHPNKIFVDWKTSPWAESMNSDQNFGMNEGVITIKDSGLYFVYAQIYYLDEHDMNGYRVYKNSEILLQCTMTSHSTETMMKGNTCYTAAATYINANDKISVGDIANGRYSLFEPGKSFFGLIKLGDVNIK